MRYPKEQPVRDHIFFGLTRGLCPECKRIVDAQVLVRDGKLYLHKICPTHGAHEALVSSDAAWNVQAEKYNKPGAIPYTFARTVEKGCPHDCGLCPEHQQHTCMGIIEITSRCNLNCTTCFADAGSGYDLTLEQIEAILDRFVETEGQPEVVQISGGEPTLHPQVLDVIAAAKARQIRHVMLNTNGLRIAQDVPFVQQLARYDPVIYLQFDGLTKATHQTLRGRDLREIKLRALDNLADAGMSVVLVAMVVRGVNEHEIGDIVRFGLEHPAVRGVSYQPITYTGRYLAHAPLDRVTLTTVLERLEEQTGGLFCIDDFIPVPCPHPDCSACTYAVIDDERVVPIPRIVNVDDYLDFVTNRTIPDIEGELQHALEGLWSMAAMIGTETTTDNLTCTTCGLEFPQPDDVHFAKRHFFMIQVHGFMDVHTFDLKRVMKCCIHELLPDGRAIPFCAYNNLGYRERVRKTLGKP
jgi:uncharacterized radical SAM superfamily Fe-S cluster-containing enzyme